MSNSLQTKLALFAAASMLAGCETMAEQPDALTQVSIDYVMQHPDSCTLSDGYVCQPLDEMTVIADQVRLVPGNYLQAWSAAYDDFQTLDELSDEQKQLRHYKIGFAENQQNYLVVFSALLLPQINVAGKPEDMLRTTLGKSMRYEIDKQSLSVVSRKYYK